MTARVPPSPLRVSEKHFQATVLELAEMLGWKTAHFHDSRREVVRRSGQRLTIGDKAAAGWPDLVLVRKGRMILAELKAEGGRLSPAQAEWIHELQNVEADTDHRVLVRVWKPSDFASGEIERTLTGRLL